MAFGKPGAKIHHEFDIISVTQKFSMQFEILPFFSVINRIFTFQLSVRLLSLLILQEQRVSYRSF